MPTDRSRVWIWCEGRRDETFLRRLFQDQFGLSNRQMEFHIAPSGLGSGAQWVTMQCGNVQRIHRAKRKQQQLGFLVMSDGDRDGWEARTSELVAGSGRGSDDHIAIWAPTWSVETWILWLNQTPPDDEGIQEGRRYKHEVSDGDFSDLVRSAVAAWGVAIEGEESTVPSLAAAKRELSRLP